MDKLLYLLSISILCMLSTILSFIASHSPLLPPIFCISTALEILSNCAYPKSSVVLPSPPPIAHSPFSLKTFFYRSVARSSIDVLLTHSSLAHALLSLPVLFGVYRVYLPLSPLSPLLQLLLPFVVGIHRSIVRRFLLELTYIYCTYMYVCECVSVCVRVCVW